MQGPYRPPPGPGPDPELARLAAQGQQRRMAMAQEHQAEMHSSGKGHLSTAIGAYRGSTLKRVMLAVIILSLASGALGAILAAVGLPEVTGFLVPGFVIAFVVFMIWVFIPPIASQGAIAAEQAWATSLPFQLAGYFEVLSGQPSFQRTVTFEIRWQPGPQRPPDRQLLISVISAVDPHARVQHADESSATLTTGAISGHTGIRVNRVPVYRNHRIPAHLHGLIDQVLVTIHRSHPIAMVTLR